MDNKKAGFKKKYGFQCENLTPRHTKSSIYAIDVNLTYSHMYIIPMQILMSATEQHTTVISTLSAIILLDRLSVHVTWGTWAVESYQIAVRWLLCIL